MKPSTLKAARALRTAGIIRTPWARGGERPPFRGAKMTGLPVMREAVNRITSQKIRQVVNNLHFHNRVDLRVSLYYSPWDRGVSAIPRGYEPGVKACARDLIDGALRRELDGELALMARGENIAANQRRQRMLGKYLLSKPYGIIRNFYGVRMQAIAANLPDGARGEKTEFYSDIIHESVSKTVSREVLTHTRQVSGAPAPAAAISAGDLDRIAARAALKLEKRMRAERERTGKWQ